MKVGILTYYGVHNHGAVLQANALKTVLEHKGHDCTFLSFERDYTNLSVQQASKYKIGLGSILFYTKYLASKGPDNIWYNLQKQQSLHAFRKSHLPIGGSYEDFVGDVAIIGSDEVFSLEIGVNPFLYGNNLHTEHIISYAASFGPTTYEDVVQQGQEKMIAQGLARMDAISVRDQNSMDVVYKVARKKAALVCDPVILYGYKDEMKCFTPHLKNYVLVYSYDKNLNDPKEYHYIQQYAQKHNLSIVSVGYYHKWCRSINASPLDLLGWVKNATMIVTDTFHGAVISLICNTPAVFKIRNNRNKMEFLLSEYGLSDRAVKSFTALEQVANTPVDFDQVNTRLENNRLYSMGYLDHALTMCQ